MQSGFHSWLSLINVDAKIFAKALEYRLENIVPTIISHEQTGFVKGRQLFLNLCILILFISVYILFNLIPPEQNLK